MLRFLVPMMAYAEALIPGEVGSDTQALLQMMTQHRPMAAETGKQPKTDATQLLVKVKSLVQSVQTNQLAFADPVRQCMGGWQSGDGVGTDGSEQSVGHQDSQDSCIAAVREQCTGANGATYVAGTTECICEIGQQQLDATIVGKANCAFFAEGTNDVALDTATSALTDLVTNILDTLQAENDGALTLVDNVFGAITTAREVPSVQNADGVQSLEVTAAARRAAADAAQAAFENCQSSLSTWSATQATTCSAWESHFESLSSCSDACPCATDSERFYSSYLTWRNILADGGGEEIERLKKACDDSTEEVNQRAGDDGHCALLEEQAALAEAESALADHRYATSWALHNQSCASLESAVEVYMATESELTLELTQRNAERCILQQVQCFLGLIVRVSHTGELLDDSNCTNGRWAGLGWAGRDPTCEPFFHIEFPEVPASPECVECPGCRTFGGGDVVAFDHSGCECSASCYSNFPNNNYCDTGHYTRCLWDRGAWQNGGYWQIITPEPENFVRFAISAPSGTAGFVKYSDDGAEWSTAADIGNDGGFPNGDLELDWSWEVGAHRFWRYEVTRRQPGNWMGNFQFFKTELASVVRDAVE